MFQGFNRIIAFSRPFYFCVCAVLVLVLDHASKHWVSMTFTVYGVPFTSGGILTFIRDLVLGAYQKSGRSPDVWETWFIQGLEFLECTWILVFLLKACKVLGYGKRAWKALNMTVWQLSFLWWGLCAFINVQNNNKFWFVKTWLRYGNQWIKLKEVDLFVSILLFLVWCHSRHVFDL